MIDEKEPIYSTFGNDPELSELLALFVSDLQDRINMMRKHFESENWAGLQRVAHQLKGAGGSYGFNPITVGAVSLEHAIKAGEPKEFIRKLMEELIALCARARTGTPDYVRFCS
jgi:HPt (histidine-containing phosphotransfer) domain-containing protein